MKRPAAVTPEQIRAVRTKLGLTQKQAAEKLGKSYRTWQDWEGGQRTMDPALFQLFKMLTD